MCSIEEKQFITYCTFKVLPSQFLATKENDGCVHVSGRPYLVFKIFKNCKISENCISLKALRNLRPGKQDI